MDNKAQLREMRIDNESDISALRQVVRTFAKDHRFDPFDLAALTTATSELARNVWVHAHCGVVEVVVLHRAEQIGLELSFKDNGPGISDLDRALAGGFSTANSLGIGLSGTKRLVDEFDIETQPGQGTTIVIRKWKRQF